MVDERALPADTMTIAVQVNGKLRGQVIVASNAAEADVIKAAETDSKILAHMTGTRVKQIYVPGKLLNFVFRP
jgi:leucyl-tRNA synthetase